MGYSMVYEQTTGNKQNWKMINFAFRQQTLDTFNFSVTVM